MPVVLFFLNALCYAGQSATGKYYAAKGGLAQNFNISKAIFATALFLIMVLLKGQGIHGGTVLPAILYGLCLTVSMHTGFLALSCGPMALTSILAAMSLWVPLVWGLLFWHETLSIADMFGTAMLLCAIILINLKKQQGYSLKWLIYSLITMVANGFCSVIQKYHQLEYPGQFQADFMLFAMGTVAVILLLSLPFQKRSLPKPNLFGACSGILNGLANLIVLIMAANQAATSLFPLISAGNVLAAWITGILFFHERIQKLQILGAVFGVFGIIAIIA